MSQLTLINTFRNCSQWNACSHALGDTQLSGKNLKEQRSVFIIVEMTMTVYNPSSIYTHLVILTLSSYTEVKIQSKDISNKDRCLTCGQRSGRSTMVVWKRYRKTLCIQSRLIIHETLQNICYLTLRIWVSV